MFALVLICILSLALVIHRQTIKQVLQPVPIRMAETGSQKDKSIGRSTTRAQRRTFDQLRHRRFSR